MFKIVCNADCEENVQCFRAVSGELYGELYLSKTEAERAWEDFQYVTDEDGGFYRSPINYWIEEASPDDFVTRRQCTVFLCQKCGSDIIYDHPLPFPLSSDLAGLIRASGLYVGHNPGCAGLTSMLEFLQD